MTHYEIIKRADKNALAYLLTALICGTLGGEVSSKKRLDIYMEMVIFLGQEVTP